MSTQRLRWSLIVILLLSFSGCVRGFLGGARPTPNAIESTEGGSPTNTPFILQVLSESNDGKKLTVRGSFIPKADWNAADVIVKLSALDQDGEQRQSLFAVGKEVTATALQSGIPTEFILSLASSNISNYQLELLWGDDAEPYKNLARATSPSGEQFLALRNLQVHRVPSEDCATPNECSVKFNISGEFYNSGHKSVSKVVVKAGFIRSDELALDGQILENERRIEIRNMTLPPGGMKPFRLSLKKDIQGFDEVAPRPVIRIISFDSK